MSDALAKAATELRVLIVSNGFEPGLVTDVAEEFAVAETALLNRFQRMFGRHPSTITQAARPVTVAPQVATERAMAWADSRSPRIIDRTHVGRRFTLRGESYIYAGKWMKVHYVFKVSNGKRYFLYDRTWVNTVDPQLKIPQKSMERARARSISRS